MTGLRLVDMRTRSPKSLDGYGIHRIKYPENFFPLRGNHESASVNAVSPRA